MLILTRRPRETITIGNDITVSVIGIRGNQVKLGIAAPLRGAGPPSGGLRTDPAREARRRTQGHCGRMR